jgi:superfamily II DNA or RNA helicase
MLPPGTGFFSSPFEVPSRRPIQSRGFMTSILVSNSFSTLTAKGQDMVHKLVDTALSYQIKNHEFIARKMGWTNWDGIKSLYTRTKPDTGVFMTGLLPMVSEVLTKNKIKHSIVDYRTDPAPDISVPEKITMADPKVGSIELYDYQMKCIQDFFNSKERRGIIKAATGAGKTEIAIGIYNILRLPTLWLTHRVNLMTQTAKRFAARIPEIESKIGYFGGGDFSPNDITFSTVQTLHNAMKKRPQETTNWLKKYQLLIVDEAHRMRSKQFYTASCHCTGAYYRVGLTATPFMRDDNFENLTLRGVIGNIVSTVDIDYLANKDLIAQPYFKFIDIKGPRLESKIRGHDIYSEGIVHYEPRNKTIAKVAGALKSAGKKMLVICHHLDHCKNIMAAGKEHGLDFPLLTGETPYEDRETQLARLAAGEINGLICTNILDEGIDVREVDTIINAAGMTSAPSLFQRTGRATRKKDGDNYCIVIDFIDNQHDGLYEQSMKRYNHINRQPGFKIL